MKKLRTAIITITAMLGLVATPLVAVPAYAADNPTKSIGEGVVAVGGKDANQKEFNDGVSRVINVLLFLLGIIAVVMIIFGAFNYVTSNGDAGKVKTARDTILYACVGLLVAILAYAIVNFVISTFVAK